jgi:dTDP-4-amino-4,6-dideoxygalactose transaminase
MATSGIQFASPGAAYRAHADEILAAIRRVAESGWYILGPEVEAFEREFAAFLGAPAAVGVANGTDAITLALRALGIGAGDRVLTVANTATATVAAIDLAGAQAEFVDIHPASMNLDPDALRQRLEISGQPPRAIVLVHLYGQPADLPRICELAGHHGIPVIEDCAQAHGARVQGRRVGTWGRAGTFSFYPTKNLGALGDGGAVATGDPELAAQVRRLRQYGWRERYVSAEPGTNSRLDEMQAAILRVKLAHLEADNHARGQLAGRYRERLAGTSLTLPALLPATEPVWHQFVVRSPRRDDLQQDLAAAGIAAAVLYPVPIHRQPGYRDERAVLPVTEQACRELLCLPIHPQLGVAEVDAVCDRVLEWQRRQR